MNKQKPRPSKQQQNKHNVKFERQLKGQNHYGKWIHISMKTTAFMWPLCVIPFLWAAAAHGAPPLRAANEHVYSSYIWSNSKWIQAHECYQYVFPGKWTLDLSIVSIMLHNAVLWNITTKAPFWRDEWKPNRFYKTPRTTVCLICFVMWLFWHC